MQDETDGSEDTMLTHNPPDGVTPAQGYSHVVMGEGRLVVISGQVALDEKGNVVGEGDPAAQARQVFENLKRCLAAGEATFADVAKLTFYVTDIGFPLLSGPRGTHMSTRSTPRPPQPYR